MKKYIKPTTETVSIECRALMSISNTGNGSKSASLGYDDGNIERLSKGNSVWE